MADPITAQDAVLLFWFFVGLQVILLSGLAFASYRLPPDKPGAQLRGLVMVAVVIGIAVLYAVTEEEPVYLTVIPGLLLGPLVMKLASTLHDRRAHSARRPDSHR